MPVIITKQKDDIKVGGDGDDGKSGDGSSDGRASSCHAAKKNPKNPSASL